MAQLCSQDSSPEVLFCTSSRELVCTRLNCGLTLLSKPPPPVHSARFNLWHAMPLTTIVAQQHTLLGTEQIQDKPCKA